MLGGHGPTTKRSTLLVQLPTSMTWGSVGRMTSPSPDELMPLDFESTRLHEILAKAVGEKRDQVTPARGDQSPASDASRD